MALATVNPATGELLREYPEMELPEILSILDKAQEDFEQWRERPVARRAGMFARVAEILRVEKEAFAAIMTKEMGKPVAEAVSEVEKCAWVCEYYAKHGADFLADQPIETEATESFVTFQPLGIILAVMPWNFPFWQVFRAAVPALIAGNVVVLKHASNVPECALTIEAIFHRAGFPLNIFRTLMLTSTHAAVAVAHPFVHGVTLTGSEEAGRKIAAQAGTQLKKTVLELGGSDAYLVLADADIDHAAQCCVASRMINGGQSCIAAKRFIVVEGVREEFEKAVVAAMRGYAMGDPASKDTRLGPMAREDLRDELHGQVSRCLAEGARLLLGGEIPQKTGAWYPATVLTDVKPGMPAYSDELFGPVAAIIPVRDEAEAIKVANDTRFGLGGAVFTHNVERARKLAREELQSGTVAVNDFVRSDPRLPFGGIRMSGYGRELADFGIREFVNIKTVVIK
ncbi:NAD-dependent succinate-semialdehyde dehydrogenase [Ruficoccus amylovorans]|uniref:NAD-dependent succinate-semialdehyde dehydrogenase n=1 Tax=Ruficoccus amylovorans TaxID=1804625 RepID=A0A842HJY4_9BACT|nr:NAD-dependent succinate-semialdehyde dehydrogenase [Ruficoccus amylovorans]MBC2595797.1 NAD-dependent succinate-semialdehyde dehydrogenase [Ruficoccus amylovorans]